MTVFQKTRGPRFAKKLKDQLPVAPPKPPTPKPRQVSVEPIEDPTIAIVVIAKNEADLDWFRSHSPEAEREARIVYVANTSRLSYAAIANPFFDACTEDVVGAIHADTSFGPGAIKTFARACLERGGQLSGIVGRRPLLASDPDPWCSYLWSSAGGGDVCTLDTCSVFMPRAIGLRFDGVVFDDFHCLVEDLCLQARDAGYQVVVPSAVASHVGSSTANQEWLDRYSVYRARLLEKWTGHPIYTT